MRLAGCMREGGAGWSGAEAVHWTSDAHVCGWNATRASLHYRTLTGWPSTYSEYPRVSLGKVDRVSMCHSPLFTSGGRGAWVASERGQQAGAAVHRCWWNRGQHPGAEIDRAGRSEGMRKGRWQPGRGSNAWLAWSRALRHCQTVARGTCRLAPTRVVGAAPPRHALDLAITVQVRQHAVPVILSRRLEGASGRVQAGAAVAGVEQIGQQRQRQ